jgi:hypothetical protein
VGRSRRTARRPRADVGLARGAAGGSRRGCPSAHLGLAGAFLRSPAAARTWAGLGRAGARGSAAAPASSRSAGAGVGWVSRSGAIVGRAALCSARTLRPAARACPGPRAAGAARLTSNARAAFMERARGSPRARVGRPGRITAVPDPDGALVEPAGSGLERPSAVRFGAGRARFDRLGCTAARGGRATTDRGTFLERPCPRGLGRAENRRTRGSRHTVMVGADRVAGRPGRGTAAVELSGAARSSHTCSVVATGAGTGRATGRPRRRGAA